MKIKLLKKEGLYVPNAAHSSDTGLDISAASDPVIVGEEAGGGFYKSISYIEYDTDLQLAPESMDLDEYSSKYGYTLVYPRSSISKYNLLLANSVAIIDHAYRGNIKIRFRYITQPKDFTFLQVNDSISCFCSVDQNKIYKRGDKIAQLVAAWKENIEWELVDSLDETQRNTGGFGSTGN